MARRGARSSSSGGRRSRSRGRGRRQQDSKRTTSGSRGRGQRAKDRSRSTRRAPASKETAVSASRPRCASSSGERCPAPASKAEPAVSSVPANPARAPEVVSCTLAARPFGMAPSKDGSVSGYVVEKVAEDKPAAQAGVAQGYRVVAVGDKDCKALDSQAVQALLKSCELPVIVQFEKPLSEAEMLPDSDEEDASGSIHTARADHRRAHEASLAKIDDLPVTRDPEGLPEPIASWREAVDRKLLSAAIVHKLHAAGLKRPTPIQSHAVPILSHKPEHWDMIAQAQTGSGKTFAFVIPTIARLVMQGCPPRPFFPGPTAQGCPVVLVLSPTRELAIQTCTEIEVLTKGTNLTQMTIYGGETIKETSKRLDDKPIDIICATPGRLVALLDTTKVSLAYVQTVVLDEADQMLEQGLEIMCADILVGRDMPAPSSGRQTLLFSATIPQKIRDLCPQILREKRTASLTIGNYSDDKGGSCASIQQILRWSPDEKERVGDLIADLRRHWKREKGRVVVFSNLRHQADGLAKQLQREGMSCKHLHGKLDQEVREKVFDGFRRGEFDILVATNVASRGLDFPDIGLVVQFHLPVGAAIGYVCQKDKRLAQKLIEFLDLNKQEVPSFLRDLAKSGGGRR
eukprot:TRINITY_DN15232_c0_g1_i2.p1 TRINITY_DN15232_c0_g1~~TRINITY_DN15232_c0_g1_i2.p1  ORF type:complete len:630 (-),score=123.40 TRINITY_DN15232_c0_g1_i2:28-1917(-)